MKDGLIGIAFTLATASRSVPSASGFAALSKPMWLSLICRKVNPVGSAATASPISPTEWGTPPLTAQSTPVPAQTMHSSTSRRPNPCPRSSKPFLAMSHLPVAKRLQMAPLIRRLGRFGLYSQTIYNFSIREFPRYHCSFRRLRLPGAGFSVRFTKIAVYPRGPFDRDVPGSGVGLAERRPAANGRSKCRPTSEFDFATQSAQANPWRSV